jgi:hypothetical protein
VRTDDGREGVIILMNADGTSAMVLLHEHGAPGAHGASIDLDKLKTIDGYSEIT